MSKWSDQFETQFKDIGKIKTLTENKMNKNPERPKNINKIISQILNPKETQDQKNKRIKKEIQKLIWD